MVFGLGNSESFTQALEALSSQPQTVTADDGDARNVSTAPITITGGGKKSDTDVSLSIQQTDFGALERAAETSRRAQQAVLAAGGAAFEQARGLGEEALLSSSDIARDAIRAAERSAEQSSALGQSAVLSAEAIGRDAIDETGDVSRVAIREVRGAQDDAFAFAERISADTLSVNQGVTKDALDIADAALVEVRGSQDDAFRFAERAQAGAAALAEQSADNQLEVQRLALTTNERTLADALGFGRELVSLVDEAQTRSAALAESSISTAETALESAFASTPGGGIDASRDLTRTVAIGALVVAGGIAAVAAFRAG